jgi:hypothetical protein
VRWRQSFVTIPPNPPHAAVSDHMNFASGIAVIVSTTFNDSRCTASIVESGEAWKNIEMWLWSSIGASSLREYE